MAHRNGGEIENGSQFHLSPLYSRAQLLNWTKGSELHTHTHSFESPSESDIVNVISAQFKENSVKLLWIILSSFFSVFISLLHWIGIQIHLLIVCLILWYFCN